MQMVCKKSRSRLSFSLYPCSLLFYYLADMPDSFLLQNRDIKRRTTEEEGRCWVIWIPQYTLHVCSALCSRSEFLFPTNLSPVCPRSQSQAIAFLSYFRSFWNIGKFRNGVSTFKFEVPGCFIGRIADSQASLYIFIFKIYRILWTPYGFTCPLPSNWSPARYTSSTLRSYIPELAHERNGDLPVGSWMTWYVCVRMIGHNV